MPICEILQDFLGEVHDEKEENVISCWTRTQTLSAKPSSFNRINGDWVRVRVKLMKDNSRMLIVPECLHNE